MILFNPSPEPIMMSCRGTVYYIQRNEKLSVAREIGNWLLDKFSIYGLVDLTMDNLMDAGARQTFMVRKILEGLDKYQEHCNYVLEQYNLFDTELKEKNLYGTILQHRNVKFHIERLEEARSMQKKLEDKFGFTIRKQETDMKSSELLKAIDDLIKEQASNQEAQAKASEQDRMFEQDLRGIVDFYQRDFKPDMLPKTEAQSAGDNFGDVNKEAAPLKEGKAHKGNKAVVS